MGPGGRVYDAVLASAPYHQLSVKHPPETKTATFTAATTGPDQAICRILDQWSLFGQDWSMVNRTGPVGL